MSDLRKERDNLQEETNNLTLYQKKLERKYQRMREDFLKMGEENEKAGLELQQDPYEGVLIKTISKKQRQIDKKNAMYFKELLQGPLDVKKKKSP